ncbi:TIR domain-containing protein [Lentzea aerocolonigenes]|uniref:TIR domain-containing protein n=1 Tax=Lentzea aerocolonigenes TaxID=68170 RepID=UPI0012DCA5DF
MIFVSYTRKDESTVQALREDLERLHWPVWMDHEIHGGEQWWREIIETIQQTRVFLFALSDASWRSRPCQEELDYAKRLGIPILPVQVGPMLHTRIPLMETHAIDYRERTPEAVLSLVAALADLGRRQVRLPEPLPEPPKVPFEYLYRMAERLGPKPIPADDQEMLIVQFRSKLKNEDDSVARADIVKLLKELRGRRELTVGNAEEIDSLLETAESKVAEPDDGATRLPPTDHWRKGRVETAPPKPKPEPEPETPVPPPADLPPRVRKPDPPISPPEPVHRWPAPETPQPVRAEPVPEEPAPAPKDEPQGDAAPAWLRQLVANGPAEQPSPNAPVTPPAEPTQRWWGAQEQQRETPPPQPEPSPQPGPRPPPKGRGLAFVSAVLGAAGLPFLYFGPAWGTSEALRAGVVILLIVVVLGVSLALVSVTRKEKHSRAALAIAVAGLVGVIVFAAASGIF